MADPDRIARLEALFDEAVALSRDERDAFLDEQCGTDTDLRARVEALLQQDSALGDDFLDSLGPARIDVSAALDVGQVIGGTYRVLGVLGRGNDLHARDTPQSCRCHGFTTVTY